MSINHMQNAGTQQQDVASSTEFTLVDLLIIFAKHKKLIITLPIALAVVSGALSFLLPNVFKSTTTLLPPQQAQSGAAALLSQLGGMASAAVGSAGLKNPNDLYVGMLKSRTVSDNLVKKFDLKKVYETSSPDEARRKLAENTSINSGKDGLITIEVESEDQKLVAPLANAYVQELLALTKVLAVTEAAQRRLFFAGQLEAAKNNLARAEMLLKTGLDEHGLVSVDSESHTRLETVARLKAQASAKEIQLNSMKAFVTANNPEFRRVEQELLSLRGELQRLENGSHQQLSTNKADDGDRKGLENIKILRDVKYFQMLYELLAKQYEVARLDEAKDASIIQVLDPAAEPERKFKPKRAVIVVLATLIGLFMAICWSLIYEAKQRALLSQDGRGRWNELKNHLKF